MSALGVTVIINNYNYGRYLSRAIESVLAQDYHAVDILVVDDGSTDNSRDVIASYGERIGSILKPNGGQASAFNSGYRASRGEFICFLDSDDWFLPTKARRVAETFAAFPGAEWVFHPLETNFPNGTVECKPWMGTAFVDIRERAITRGKLSVLAPPTSGLCLARNLLNRLLPMPENIRITSDNYLKFGAMALAPGVYLAEALAAQRIHSSNAYTLRADRLPLQARMHLLIAEGLSERHPQLARLADKVFAKALADYVGARERNPSDRAIVSKYLAQAGFTRASNILARAGYHYAKNYVFRRAQSRAKNEG